MLWDVDSKKIMESRYMLFDETFIMNPTWNGDDQIIKEIINKTTALGQIIGLNVGFEGHEQGVGVVLPIAPNQF
jgi:hypothetical protein